MGLFLRLSPSAGASLTLPHSHVSSPRPSNRTCGFPASGSHPGSCPSPTEGSSAHRPGGCGAVSRARPGNARLPGPVPGGRGAATGKPARSFPTPRHLPVSRPIGPRLPSLPHAARSGVSGHITARIGFCQSPRPFPPSFALPRPRPLRSAGVTRPLRYYGAYPPPCRPKLALAGSRLARAPHRQGFPCCHCFPLTRMLPSLPRRNRPVLASLASRPLAAFPEFWAGRLPHYSFRGLLNVHCSLRPARSLSRPRRPFDIEVLQPMSLPP